MAPHKKTKFSNRDAKMAASAKSSKFEVSVGAATHSRPILGADEFLHRQILQKRMTVALATILESRF
jgi:hypothetical protein